MNILNWQNFQLKVRENDNFHTKIGDLLSFAHAKMFLQLENTNRGFYDLQQ